MSSTRPPAARTASTVIARCGALGSGPPSCRTTTPRSKREPASSSPDTSWLLCEASSTTEPPGTEPVPRTVTGRASVSSRSAPSARSAASSGPERALTDARVAVEADRAARQRRHRRGEAGDGAGVADVDRAGAHLRLRGAVDLPVALGRVRDVVPEGAQRLRHQLGVAAAQRAPHDAAPGGQGGQHEGPVGDALAARQRHDRRQRPGGLGSGPGVGRADGHQHPAGAFVTMRTGSSTWRRPAPRAAATAGSGGRTEPLGGGVRPRGATTARDHEDGAGGRAAPRPTALSRTSSPPVKGSVAGRLTAGRVTRVGTAEPGSSVVPCAGTLVPSPSGSATPSPAVSVTPSPASPPASARSGPTSRSCRSRRHRSGRSRRSRRTGGSADTSAPAAVAARGRTGTMRRLQVQRPGGRRTMVREEVPALGTGVRGVGLYCLDDSQLLPVTRKGARA